MKTQNYDFMVPVLKSVEADQSGEWIIEGIASTPGVDLLDDVVLPENFLNTLEFFKQKGQIYYNHNYARKNESQGGTVPMKAQLPIGKALDAKLTPEGLYIKAVLNKSNDLAKDLWYNHLNNPDERFREIGLSIGARAKGQAVRKYSPEHKKMVNFLPELLLYEVSVTPTPVNPNTWVRVIKSLVDEAELAETNSEGNNNVEIVRVTPDEVIYDNVNNVMVVKSTIENEDGTKFILEHTFNPQEDIQKAMTEDTDKKPQEQDTPPVEGNEKDTNASPEEVSQEPPFGGEEGASDSAPEAAPEGAPEAAPEGGADAGAEGGLGDMLDGAEGGAEGGLDDLFGGDTGEATDPMASEGDSAVQSMILDKLDTVVDALTTLVQDFAAQKGGTVGVDTETQPPAVPAPDTDVIKSVMDDIKVEISKDIKENLVTVIKSALLDDIRAIVKGEVDLVIQNPVLKSMSNTNTKETVVIRQPQVELAESSNVGMANAGDVVLKSFDGHVLDADVLKSLSEEYHSIVGHAPGMSQRRAKVLERAESKLGISEAEFKFHARKFASK